LTQALHLELPWPPSTLSPNGSHGHWAKKRDAKRRYRQACATATLLVSRGRRALEVPLQVELVFHPPADGRRRDRDNLMARMKSGLDGIAQALQVDDSLFRPTAEIGEPAASKADACVAVTITVAETETPRPQRTPRGAGNKEK